MFVNPINNFNVTNAFKFQALKDNETGSEKPTPTEPQPEESPKMKPQLMQDTISFGESHKKSNVKNIAKSAAVATLFVAPLTNCSDYESYHELNSATTINLADYHKCPLDSIPIIIYPGCNCKPDDGCNCGDEPGEGCNCGGNECKPDTVWITKNDTIYVPKIPHFEINDSINKDIDDFDIPTEGDGDFVYAMTGTNEYLDAHHALVFNGFFSSERQSSFIDHAFEGDDVVDGKPTQYYYTRYDISSVPAQGARYVKVYTPKAGVHTLPNDKETGESGWRQTDALYIKNKSTAQIKEMIINGELDDLRARITKNEHRGPGNLYKEWPLKDGSMPKTTLKDVKAYRKDLSKDFE